MPLLDAQLEGRVTQAINRAHTDIIEFVTERQGKLGNALIARQAAWAVMHAAIEHIMARDAAGIPSGLLSLIEQANEPENGEGTSP